MLWLPVTLLLAALGLSELLRQLDRPATGLTHTLLGVAFALGAVGVAVMLVGELDIDTAGRALEWARARLGSQPGLVTAILAVLGFALAFGGGARVVERVALADPDGPLPDTGAPALASGLGVLLLVASLMRL